MDPPDPITKEIRALMEELLTSVEITVGATPEKPKRKRTRRPKKPVEKGAEPIPFVPKTLEEIMRNGWDFQKFILEIPILTVSYHEQWVISMRAHMAERLHFFNQTPIMPPEPLSTHLPPPPTVIQPQVTWNIPYDPNIDARLRREAFGVAAPSPIRPAIGANPAWWHS